MPPRQLLLTIANSLVERVPTLRPLAISPCILSLFRSYIVTREAFRLYWELLEPDGVLAVNITHKSLDLAPVVLAQVHERKKRGLLVHTPYRRATGAWLVDWVLLTDDETVVGNAPPATIAGPMADGLQPIVWTDDYSNLFQVLK